jgi:hypothetical protein
MSYCRFLEGDVYMYASSLGGIACAMCTFAPRVPSIFTTGTGPDDPLFPNLPPCEQCQGTGCDHCMMPGSQHFSGVQEAYEHLITHRQAGHEVPQRAFQALIDDGAQPF